EAHLDDACANERRSRQPRRRGRAGGSRGRSRVSPRRGPVGGSDAERRRGARSLSVSRRGIADLHPAPVEVGGAAWTERDGYTLKEDARRFETLEASHALQLGLGRAVDYALELGIDSIWERVRALGDLLRRELAAIDEISVHDLGATKCGIVTFTAGGVSADLLARDLGARAINVDVSKPEDTRLDFEAGSLEPM